MSNMLRALGGLLVVLMVIGTGVRIFLAFQKTDTETKTPGNSGALQAKIDPPTPAQRAAAAPRPTGVLAEKLAAAYAANEVAADAAYKGRRMRILGKILAIEKDEISGEPRVKLKGGAFLSDVWCYVPDRNAPLTEMKKGLTVAFDCTVTGSVPGINEAAEARSCTWPTVETVERENPELLERKKRRRDPVEKSLEDQGFQIIK